MCSYILKINQNTIMDTFLLIINDFLKAYREYLLTNTQLWVFLGLAVLARLYIFYLKNKKK